MPTKRNDTKEFAIGSKIEYNGKLYEVVSQTYCDNCAIANICCNNDKTSDNNITGVLSRDKRVSIFGECSSIVRSDGRSVVFKEIPINISKDKYYKIIPLWRDDNPSELKPVKFDLPNGYEIDIEASDLSKSIVHFKRKWLTLEQLYNSMTEYNISQYRNNCMNFAPNKLLAIANLMDIARYCNGNWHYRTRDDNYGYTIAYDKTRTADDSYQIVHINSDTDMYFGNIIFKNEADAQYVIDNPNFRSILDKIFKV